MHAFDAIDEAITSRQVANEWRATGERIVPSTPHTASFNDRLRTVLECYTTLCAILSLKGSDTPPMLNAFDDALSQIASVETSVSDLLALRGERAKTMLEAIQMYLRIIPEHHPRRRGAIHLLIKLAHRSEQLPTSLFIEKIIIQSYTRPLLGGFGDIYLGTHVTKTVAVKKLRIIGGDDVAYKKLCREALVWRQLRHANILPFIGLSKEVFPESPLPALVSPWMENGSLRDYIKSPNYDAASEVPLLLSGIANGIAYLHTLSITHGDIKHLNILVDSACRPRLADFGLVRLDDSATAGGFTNTTNGFDLRWTSPQRLDDHVRTLSDDVYSFGCVGYYLYAGRVLFEGFTEGRTLMRIMQGERPSRPSSGNGCSLEPTDETWSLISRCWAHDSGARPTMAEVCNWNWLAVPTPAGTSRPLSEPITSPIASTGLLAQPVLPRGGRRSGPAWWAGLTARLKPRKDRHDGGDSCDTSNGNSPVPSPINSWCLLSEDSKSGSDPCPEPVLDGDVDGCSMISSTGADFGSDSLAFQAKPALSKPALSVYNADPEDPNEINFAEGEVLNISNRSGEWWAAEKSSGQIGIAPSNYLQIL